MRWLVVLLVGCHATHPVAPSNVAVPELVTVGVTIEPDSEGLRDKRHYWKKWGRAYMSQVPGPVCICEQKPSFTVEGPAGPVTSYLTVCSTYH